jgi:hypothetical protein
VLRSLSSRCVLAVDSVSHGARLRPKTWWLLQLDALTSQYSYQPVNSRTVSQRCRSVTDMISYAPCALYSHGQLQFNLPSANTFCRDRMHAFNFLRISGHLDVVSALNLTDHPLRRSVWMYVSCETHGRLCTIALISCWLHTHLAVI